MRSTSFSRTAGMLIGAVVLGGALGILSISLPSVGGRLASRGPVKPGDCGYYTTSVGNQVPRPCGNWRADHASTPAGATALCEDGTYSFSEHPYYKYTCSYHGGVVKHLP